MPTGVVFQEQTGLPASSKSLGRAPAPYFSVRTMPFGAMDKSRDVRVYGDAATMTFMTSLSIPWGPATPSSVDVLVPGWSWVWDIHRAKLTVTDASGAVTVRKASTWSELAVSMGVISSHQFIYYFDGEDAPDPFLIATRPIPRRTTGRDGITWGENEKYVLGDFHVLFHRMTAWLTEDGILGQEPPEFDAVEELWKAIVVATREIEATGYFPYEADLANIEYQTVAKPKKEARKAMLERLGKWLFCAALTASLLGGTDNHGNPCYEPWMLFAMWKWLQGPRNPEHDDGMFELSPCW